MMTNLEKIRKMTVDELVKQNVRPFTYMNGYKTDTEFHTSDNSIFDTRDEAEEYEHKWLNSEAE